jgi:hypothetical protein
LTVQVQQWPLVLARGRPNSSGEASVPTSSGAELCFQATHRNWLLSRRQDSWKMTRNQELNVLHVKNSTEFAKGIDARIVSSDTLIFDFIYFLHPVRINFDNLPCLTVCPLLDNPAKMHSATFPLGPFP